MPGHLALLALVSLVLITPPAGAQPDRAAHQQFLFAYKLYQQQEYELAAEAFDEYLGDFPKAAKRGDALYFRALLHRRAGELEAAADAIEPVEKAQLLPPYAVDLLRGQIYLDLDEHAQAVAALERIGLEKLEPKVKANVRYLRGLAYRGAANLEAAAQSLSKAANTHPSVKGQSLLTLARIQAEQDRRAKAVATLRRALTVQAVAAEAAHLAGDLSYELEHYDDAAELYRRVLNNHQSSTYFGPAVIGLLWTHFSAEQYQGVIDTFQQYQGAIPKPQRGEAAYLLGSAHYALQQYEQAAKRLASTLNALDGDQRVKALYKLADAQFQLGRYGALERSAKRLGQQFSDHELTREAIFLLVEAKAKQGDRGEAVQQLSQLLEADASAAMRARALRRRASLYTEAGALDRATADLQRFLKLSPSDDGPLRQAMLSLVDLHYRQKQYAKAIKLADQLLAKSQVKPARRQEALYRKALALVKQGERDQAVQTLQRLQKAYPLNPFQAQAQYYLGLLWMSQDQGEKAADHLQKAADADKLSQSQRVNALRLLALHQRQLDAEGPAIETLRRLADLAGAEALTVEETLWLGRQLVQRGGVKPGVGHLERLIDKQSSLTTKQRATAGFWLGRAYRRLGQYNPAEQQLRRVIAQGAGFGLRARLELGYVLAARGAHQQAIAELDDLFDSVEPRIAAEALVLSGEIGRQMAQQAARDSRPEAAASARKTARKRLMKVVLVYDAAALNPLPHRARLTLAALAEDSGNAKEQRQHLQQVAAASAENDKTLANYARYAELMLNTIDAGLGQQRIANLQALRDQVTDPALGRRIDRRLGQWTERG
jgi:tetratricopeptide (TPR) repeat protein